MKRAVIYARYSAGPQQTEQSIEGQVRVCKDYAANNDMVVIDIYIDKAISGRTDKRPEFQKLIRDSFSGNFEAVIVYKTDRFSRSKYDHVVYKDMLEKNGVKVYSATEHIPEGSGGILFETLLEATSAYYSAELSEKVRRGMKESALKGKCVGGNLALGYKVAPDKSFLIDEDTAPIVRKIFEMYIAGKRYSEIQSHLNNIGFKTRRGKPFSKNSVPNIIKNEKYVGIYVSGDVRLEGIIPPIVSEEVFQMAQDERKKRKGTRAPKSPDGEYLLSRKLFCGHCKAPMTGVSGTSKTKQLYHYYYCANGRNKKSCDKKHVGRDWLEDLVMRETLEYVLQPDKISYLAKLCHEIMLNHNDNSEEVKYWEKKVSENQKAIDNVLRAIETASVVTEQLPVRLKELENERWNLKSELRMASIKKPILSEEHFVCWINTYSEPWKDKEDLDAYKRRILKTFVSEVHLYDDKMIIIYNFHSDGKKLDQTELDLLDACTQEYYSTSGRSAPPLVIKSNTKVTMLLFPAQMVLVYWLNRQGK